MTTPDDVMPDETPNESVAGASPAGDVPPPAEPSGPEIPEAAGIIDALSEQLRARTDERDQLRDQVLRSMADFQNFRKRMEEQREKERQFAAEKLVVALLPVLDNLERALGSLQAGASPEAVLEGIGGIQKQLLNVLEGQGVERLTVVGQPFDPEVHEAIGTDATEDVPDDHVSVELEAGYRLGGRVIRPARVKVARKP